MTIETGNGTGGLQLTLSDGEAQGAASESFQIDNDGKANWLVRKIVELRAYRDRVDQWAASEKARAMHEEDFLMMRFGGQLRDWAAGQIAAFKGRRKSLGLPAGTVGFRRSPARLVVDDDASVIEWAKKSCPEAVEIVQKLSRSILKDYFERTGDMPTTGAHVQPENEDFFIR